MTERQDTGGSVYQVIRKYSSEMANDLADSETDKSALKSYLISECYEYLLKRKPIINDDRTNYSFCDLTLETMIALYWHNKQYWNRDVRLNISRIFDSLDGEFDAHPEKADVMIGLLKIVLLLNEHSPPRKPKGILKYYRRPSFFESIEDIQSELENRIRSTGNSKFSINYPTVAKSVRSNCQFFSSVFSSIEEINVQSSLLSRRKLKKSATWDERMNNLTLPQASTTVVKSSSSTAINSGRTTSKIRRSSNPFQSSYIVSSLQKSQPFSDEGFVTPNDDHVQVSPESCMRTPGVRKRNVADISLWKWEIVKDPPVDCLMWETLNETIDVRISYKNRLVSQALRFSQLEFVKSRYNKWRSKVIAETNQQQIVTSKHPVIIDMRERLAIGLPIAESTYQQSSGVSSQSLISDHQPDTPPPILAKSAIKLRDVVDDAVFLLFGDSSRAFSLVNGEFIMSSGLHTACGIMPPDLKVACSLMMSCGTIFSNIINFLTNQPRFHSSVLTSVCDTLRSYLFDYKDIVINAVENRKMEIIIQALSKPFQHMRFLWDCIKCDGINFSVNLFLDRMHWSLSYITDPSLISLIAEILMNATDAYTALLIQMIRTGYISSDIIVPPINQQYFVGASLTWLMNQSQQQQTAISLNRIPKCLALLTDTVTNSMRTLYLLHKDGRMMEIRKMLSAKQAAEDSNADLLICNPKESLRIHLKKFMKEMEEKNEQKKRIKREELKRILDDIASKQEWKEMELRKQEEADRKSAETAEKIQRIKDQLLQDAKKELIDKYEKMSRATEKGLALTEWKLKRLAISERRQEIFQDEMRQEAKFRSECETRGIDLATANLDVKVKPLNLCGEERETDSDIESTVPEMNYQSCVRDDEAKIIKDKVLHASSIIQDKLTDTETEQIYSKDFKNLVDKDSFLAEYKINQERAKKNKETVTISRVSAAFDNPYPEEMMVCKYQGLTEEERSSLEKQLVENVYHDLSVEFKNVLFHTKPSRSFFQSNLSSRIKRNDLLQNCAEFKIYALKSTRALINEIEIANSIVLGVLKSDFICAVQMLRQYYLLGDGLWSFTLARSMLEAAQRGTWDCKKSKVLTGGSRYINSMNKLLPDAIHISAAAVTSDKSNTPVDLTQPSSISDLVVLSYRPSWPVEDLFVQKITVRYQDLFHFLIQIEIANGLLVQMNNNMNLKRLHPHGYQFRQVQMYRHVMLQFVICLKGFLQANIDLILSNFNGESEKSKSIDELFQIHVVYINRITLLCCSKKKMSNLMNNLYKILRSIYLFAEVVNCSEWSSPESNESCASAGSKSSPPLINSNFPKLEHTFKTYLSQVKYLCSYLKKFEEMGFTKSIVPLTHQLCINNFYSLTL